MKTLFVTVALAATVAAFPALAEGSIGCKWEEPLNSSAKSTNCHQERFFVDSQFIYSPLYDGSAAFAYVPSRPLVLRRGMRNDRNSLEEETQLKGGND